MRASTGPAERWLAVARRRHDRGRRRRDGRLRVRRGDPGPVRRDLERVLRLGPRVREGPARRRVAAGGRARGHLVDPRRRARHLPAAAPSGHAVHHRGALGVAAASRVGSAAAHRRPLARGGGARPGGRARPRVSSSTSSGASATPGPRPGSSRRRGCRSTSRIPAAARSGLRGPRAGDRAAGPGPPARPSPDGRRPAPVRRTDPPTCSSSPGSSRRSSARPRRPRMPRPPAATEARLERELAETEARLDGRPPAAWPTPSFTSKAPAAIVDGARRQEAELAERADRLRDDWIADASRRASRNRLPRADRSRDARARPRRRLVAPRRRLPDLSAQLRGQRRRRDRRPARDHRAPRPSRPERPGRRRHLAVAHLPVARQGRRLRRQRPRGDRSALRHGCRLRRLSRRPTLPACG